MPTDMERPFFSRVISFTFRRLSFLGTTSVAAQQTAPPPRAGSAAAHQQEFIWFFRLKMRRIIHDWIGSAEGLEEFDHPAAVGSRRAGVFARRAAFELERYGSPLIENSAAPACSIWGRPRRGFCGFWSIHGERDRAHH